ncbi:MAG: aminopeptidase N [Cyanobacteriota bacterium]|nr:aminopeptidase N [Cyanobacteriota bacterium]
MSVVRRTDYRPAPYLVPRIQLNVQLFADHALVACDLHLQPNPLATEEERATLPLKGVELELLDVHLDGERVPPEAFVVSSDGLTLLSPPQRPFRLSSRVRIHPHTNSSLEGLYVSDGMVTSQCEAEGFRRITFHPDRPDVLSRYRVRIEADRSEALVLLSNGNCVEEGILPEAGGTGQRHFAVWDDPFPKPSYLFALVAGHLREVSDSFTTVSGKQVSLRLHVEEGDEPYTAHAMQSLKRAMEWEEKVYGLEYDLDQFNIVAVRHFNMGAMENKSLNLFNSKLVLADNETATDGELERVESVIAHEYFHNWTGNRITCRDWFQLSLKEGLTVYRDQCFSADLHGHSLVRMETAALLRNTQFREDGGPTAHPIQPDHYEAIDNFYTTTIYEKGAEVIRVLHTLLGDETFMAGIRLYVERHDGTAATCEDFVQALEDAAHQSWVDQKAPFDFQQFRHWYHQAGTPTLTVRRRWHQSTGTLELTIRQSTPPTPGQEEKVPLVIPLALGLVDQAGHPVAVRLATDPPGPPGGPTLPRHWGAGTRLLVIDQPTQTVQLEGLPRREAPPALSVLRHFSAPVKVKLGRPTREMVHLLSSDSDAFARWDAGQTLLRRAGLRRAEGRPDQLLEEELIDAFRRILADPSLSEATRALLLSLPGLQELQEDTAEPDPPALFAAQRALERRFGMALADPLQEVLEECLPAWIEPWPGGSGARQLTGLIWRWRVAAGDAGCIAAARAAVEGSSMTLARAGLGALQCHPLPERQAALDAFYHRWQHKPVILDSWFALEAGAPFPDGLDRVKALLGHPRFDPMAPNAVRAVLGGLAGNAPVFHAADGSGYIFLADQISQLDRRNPITASRLVKVFSRWRSFGPRRREQMGQALQQLAGSTLSANTREVVEQCLGTSPG